MTASARTASETYTFTASPAVCPVRRLEDRLANAVVYVPGKVTPMTPLRPVSEIVSGGFCK